MPPDDPQRTASAPASALSPSHAGDRWRLVNDLVDAALDLPSEERHAFIDRSCAHDAALRDEVARLVDSCDRAERVDGFLTGQASAFAAPVLQDLAAARTAAEASALAALKAALVGRYAIEREIGRGATATVYLARDLAVDRLVAIKVLHPEMTESTGAHRFLREIRLTSRLEHPRILPVLDAGEQAGQLYFVLPYMDGGTLRERLSREKQLPVADAVAIARAIADALDHAHQRGLVHRDVKPENILFASGEPWLADFGIARALETALGESSTSGSVVRGTVPYMSPEQASGERTYDGRSDVYSLGCVLYEMLAGVQAFIGPSQDAILAQKLLHPPRPLRVFRPNVSAALEVIVMKALAIAPADRFRSAGEMAGALEGVSSDYPALAAPTPWEGRGRLRLRWTGLAAGATVVLASVTIALAPGFGPRGHDVSMADTTTIVVLPPEYQGADSRSHDGDLLHDAVSRWRGITVVDRFRVAETRARRGEPRTHRDAAALASAVGAGRYIRTRLRQQSGAWHAYAALYDVGSSRALHHASELIPADVAGAAGAYARLADALLLRSALDDTVASAVYAVGTLSLPALQAAHRAQRAVDDWDLARADSAFESAVGFDPQYARANLWLAQVRAWRGLDPAKWLSFAENSASAVGLSARESRLASALVLLGRARFESACTVYDGLRRDNDRDFAAWFGLGMCRRMDRAVIRDASSPTGWRFRSSYHSAITAYTKAFEILPSVHHGYERGAFEELLRIMLVTATDVFAGHALDQDSSVFHGRPAWAADGDSLVVIPYPGTSDSTPPTLGRALRRQRARLERIAASWSAAYPRSPSAKLAVAMALELLGDPRSIDTLRLARRLTTDSGRAAQLGAREVLVRLKFGLPRDVEQLRIARAVSDSLLARRPTTSTEAEALAPLATLTGRCRDAESLVRQVGHGAFPPVVAPHIPIELNAILARASLGCTPNPSGPRLRELTAALSRERGGLGRHERWVEEALLMRPALLEVVLDSVVVSRLALGSGNALVKAAHALVRHDTGAVRAWLSEFSELSRVDQGPPTPDMVLPGARMLAQIGDRESAIRWLDTTLGAVRLFDPRVLGDPARAAALVRVMALRADLAASSGDFQTAREWAAPVVVLWSESDADLRALVGRMRGYAELR